MGLNQGQSNNPKVTPIKPPAAGQKNISAEQLKEAKRTAADLKLSPEKLGAGIESQIALRDAKETLNKKNQSTNQFSDMLHDSLSVLKGPGSCEGLVRDLRNRISYLTNAQTVPGRIIMNAANAFVVVRGHIPGIIDGIRQRRMDAALEGPQIDSNQLLEESRTMLSSATVSKIVPFSKTYG